MEQSITVQKECCPSIPSFISSFSHHHCPSYRIFCIWYAVPTWAGSATLPQVSKLHRPLQSRYECGEVGTVIKTARCATEIVRFGLGATLSWCLRPVGSIAILNLGFRVVRCKTSWSLSICITVAKFWNDAGQLSGNRCKPSCEQIIGIFKTSNFNAHCPKFLSEFQRNLWVLCEVLLGFCLLFYLAMRFLSGTTRASHFTSIPAWSRFYAKQGVFMYETLLLSLTLHSQSKPWVIQSGVRFCQQSHE
jgi:hypothetical protein